MGKPLSKRRIAAVWMIAMAADALQFALLPLFAGGALEGADLIVDGVVAVLMIALCGFHPAFLPTMIAEALPVVDLVPSWTLAAMFVTRNRGKPPALASATRNS